MNPNEGQIDPQQECQTVLPPNYAAPDVQELGDCAELTLGICCFLSEDSGQWC
jgi:hypothetical protein